MSTATNRGYHIHKRVFRLGKVPFTLQDIVAFSNIMSGALTWNESHEHCLCNFITLSMEGDVLVLTFFTLFKSDRFICFYNVISFDQFCSDFDYIVNNAVISNYLYKGKDIRTKIGWKFFLHTKEEVLLELYKEMVQHSEISNPFNVVFHEKNNMPLIIAKAIAFGFVIGLFLFNFGIPELPGFLEQHFYLF